MLFEQLVDHTYDTVKTPPIAKFKSAMHFKEAQIESSTRPQSGIGAAVNFPCGFASVPTTQNFLNKDAKTSFFHFDLHKNLLEGNSGLEYLGRKSGTFFASRESKKQMQNTNAIKFRLNSLVMQQMRYQVIYKKLVRSLRKFYARKFASAGHTFVKEEPKKFVSNLMDFVAQEFGAHAEKLKFDIEDLAISFGALIQPKIVQKHYEGAAEPLARIEVVYDYLYKFSFERLQEFLNDPIMVLFFFNMIEDKCA